MKIVNEKGKLFGVINVVDLLVVVFIVAVVGGVAWKIFGDRIAAATDTEEPVEYTDVTYTVRVIGVRDTFAETVAQMDYPQQLGVNEGLVDDSYIVSVEVEPATVLSTDGAFAAMVEYDRKDLVFTIEAKVEQGDFITVGTQEIRIGKAHTVKSQFIEFGGTVETMYYDRDAFTSAEDAEGNVE